MKTYDEKEAASVTQLKSALDQMERVTHKPTPSPEWFVSFVGEQKRLNKKKMKKELLLFLSAAPFAVFSTMATLAYGIGAFLIFHSIVLAAISFPVVLRKRKRVDV